MQLSKNQNLFAQILLCFSNLHKTLILLKKSKPHNLNISEIVDSEERGYLDV